MEKLIKVAINDFKLVFRDNSLKFFFVFPILNLLVVRYGLPYVAENFVVLKDYILIILMFVANQGSLIFGFIYSMVLIDEKDTNVAKVYGILPVSKFWFVLFRLIAPFIFATLATFLILLVEPFYDISIILNLVYSALAGLIAPMMVLFVAIMAKNKLEGMTWQKLFNIPVTLPVLAFFVPASFSFFFAILPTHWAYQGFNNLIKGESYVFYLFIGFIFNFLLIGTMAQRFSKSHFQ
jgi:fluoroquinolone transport system permease protein